jgi:hypothetical protein
MRAIRRAVATAVIAGVCAAGLGWLGGSLAVLPAAAEELSLFRIGTGGIGGTYYPIAGLVAQAISNPAGTCESGDTCGVPGLVAVAQSSSGSVANVKDIAAGRIESGFVQSDVAFWAYAGINAFADEGRLNSLRAIANLYPESFHLVVRRDSGISRVGDLAGKRVALDQAGSGTLVGARLVLEAFGLTEQTLEVSYLKSDDAMDKLAAGELDAFFLIAGYPAKVVQWAGEQMAIALVPINGPETATLVKLNPFLQKDSIPAGVYGDVGAVETLSVAAQWITRNDVSTETIYGILDALWRSDARRLLDRGHAKGRSIRLETALDGIGLPLHDGALRFYQDMGLIERRAAADSSPG